MAGLIERLAIIVDAKTGGAVTEFKKVGAASKKLGDDTQVATGKMDKMASKLGVTSGALSAGLATAALAGGAAIAKFAADGVSDFVNLADKVRSFKIAAHSSAEEASRFIAVFDDFGISAEEASKAVFKLGREAGQNEEKLAGLGVEIARNKDGTANLTETLLNVADAYSASNDPLERSRIALAAFGKAGQNLLPVLDQGRAGLKAFFDEADLNRQILSDEDLKQARDYELAIDALSDAMEGLQRGAGQRLVPMLTGWANGMAGAVTWADKMIDKANGIPGPIGDVEKVLGWLGRRSSDAAESTDDLATAQGDLGRQVEDATEEIEKQNDELRKLTSAQIAAFDSGLGLESANIRFQESSEDAAKALAEHGVKSDEYRDALLRQKEAIGGVVEATVRAAEDQAKAKGVTLDAKAALELQIATLERLSAQTSGPTKAAVDGLLAQLREIKPKEVTISVDTSRALQQLAGLGRTIAAIPGLGAIGVGLQVAAAAGVKGRQHGGPVMGGTPYVVGEAGPELFVPGASGQIIPNNRMGGGGVTLVVNAGIGIDAHAVGSQLVEFIEAHERRSGKAWRN